MRTSHHFDSGGRLVRPETGAAAYPAGGRPAGGGGGKTGMGIAVGANGFGARSSRGTGLAAGVAGSGEQDLSGYDDAGAAGAPVRAGGASALSEAALQAHDRSSALAAVDEEPPRAP